MAKAAGVVMDDEEEVDVRCRRASFSLPEAYHAETGRDTPRTLSSHACSLCLLLSGLAARLTETVIQDGRANDEGRDGQHL